MDFNTLQLPLHHVLVSFIIHIVLTIRSPPVQYFLDVLFLFHILPLSLLFIFPISFPSSPLLPSLISSFLLDTFQHKLSSTPTPHLSFVVPQYYSISIDQYPIVGIPPIMHIGFLGFPYK